MATAGDGQLMARVLGWLWWIIAFGRRRAWMARRDHRNLAFLAFTALAAIGDVIAAVWSLSLVLFLVAIGEWVLAGVAACLFSGLMMRRVMIEHVTVPLGLYRTTYLLAEIDRWFMNEPLGVARLTAARAMARTGVPESAEAWWKSVQPGRVGAYEIAAAAVIADARGDRADARMLFESLALLREPAPTAREIAAEWLALDDAKAGRWDAIVERSTAMARPGRGVHRKPEAIEAEHAQKAATHGEMLWPPTGLTFFLEGVAGRMLGRVDAPSQVGLAVRWMESRRRREMWDVMKMAMGGGNVEGVKEQQQPPTSTSTPTSTGPLLARAIEAHTVAVAKPDEAGLAAAAKAWDAAFADQTWRFEIAQRAISLGAPSDAASRAVEEMRLQVVGDVATAILAAGVSLPGLLARGGDSGILGAAAARARAELLARLELSFERIGGRVHEHTAIAPIDEWRTFLAVRAAYTEAARQGGLELERLAFPHAHGELTSWSVWMWNDRKEHAISHGMTTWLFERALAVGDAQAIELHGKNAQLEPAEA
jgi:hypothetical protein